MIGSKLRLGDVLVERNETLGHRPEPVVLTLTEKNGFVPQSERFNKRLATADTSKYKVVRRWDFAFNPYLLWAGALAMNDRVDKGIVSPLYPIFSAKPGFDPSYLRYLLLSSPLISMYDGIAFGSVPRRRRSSVKDFFNLELPHVPPLDEQRRIAAVLDHVDDLRAKRRRSLAVTGSLLRAETSRVCESSDSNRVNLGDVARFYAGGSLPRGVDFSGEPDGYLLLKVSDMNTPGNERELRTASLWSPTPGPRSSTAPPGSVVIPKRGASIATNKKRLLQRPAILDPNLMAIAPGPDLESSYLIQWFSTFDLQSITSGSSVPQLNKKDLVDVKIPVPPIELQREFAARVTTIEDMWSSAERHLAALDALLASLQSRAFAGELDVSNVTLPS